MYSRGQQELEGDETKEYVMGGCVAEVGKQLLVISSFPLWSSSKMVIKGVAMVVSRSWRNHLSL